MALLLDLKTSPIGLPLPEAYARVSEISANKEKVQVQVLTFATEEARKSMGRPVIFATHSFDTATLTGDLFPAVYAALKALPEYEGAKDC